MIATAWLIAEREFRTYAGTWTFWLALLIGPVLMALVVPLAGAGPNVAAFTVSAPDPRLEAAAREAVAEALALEGRKAAEPTDRGPAVTIQRTPGGELLFSYASDFPLSPSGRQLVLRTMEAREAGLTRSRYRLAPPPPADLTQASRLTVLLMLWLSLVGSIGMLLQAVVRERSNRALESLLASAGALPIVVGKTMGVGLVSLLVLGVWLASAGGAAALAPAGAEMLPALLRAVGDPVLLARAGLIYVLAYAFFGLSTVAIGAVARDTAAAQNLVRPLFLVLIGAFFVALVSAGNAESLPRWLIFFPPLTPFLLLMRPATLAVEAVALLLLMVSAGGAGLLASILLKRVLDPKGGGRLRA